MDINPSNWNGDYTPQGLPPSDSVVNHHEEIIQDPTSENVIHGQDMGLLQRPLLESPSGSDSSKVGDDEDDDDDEDNASTGSGGNMHHHKNLDANNHSTNTKNETLNDAGRQEPGGEIMKQEIVETTTPSMKRDRTTESEGMLVERVDTDTIPPKKIRLEFPTKVAFDDTVPGGVVSVERNDTLTSSPSPPSKPAIQVSSLGIFDDAEEDETLHLQSSENATSSHQSPSIRPDLVAAILGSPPKPKVPTPVSTQQAVIAATPIVLEFPAKSPDDQKKKKVIKPSKKVWMAKKEQDAAFQVMDGKIDLLRVFPKDICEFLGRECFVFTLQQLEFILGNDENPQDTPIKEQGRRLLAERLLKNNLLGTTKSQGTDAQQHIEENSESQNVVSDPLDPTSALEQKLDEWRKTIKEWKGENHSKDTETQFPLDGPLSCLIPLGTSQLIKSANVKTAFEFLSLKKTETGLIVEMMNAWRSICGLSRKQSLPLSKHLLGINTRIEMAISGKVGLDQDRIIWTTGEMIVMTGAANDFICDECKIYSASEFIEMRTKYLADKLSNWREEKGLPVLKGSGKVAMISAWKAQLRDEIDITESKGKIVSEEDLKKEVEATLPSTPQDTKKRKVEASEESSKKKPAKEAEPKYFTPEAREALDSEEFFFSVFGDDSNNMEIFKAVGIKTARNLIDADKGQNSDFLKAVLATKSGQNEGKVQASSCIRLLYNWAAKVKSKLDDIETGKKIEPNKDASPKVEKKDRPVPRDRKSISGDPFDALSSSSKEFLATMNISTASQFLAARTTDIANAFIKWREDRNMPALKGLGAVASVSGWKKLVRNKAVAVGDDDLAQLNQASNAKAPGQDKQSSSKIDSPKKTSHALDNLTNNGRKIHSPSSSDRAFSVLSSKEDCVLHFELDIRKNPSGGEFFYLTYLGNDLLSALPEKPVVSNSDEESVGSLPILRELGKVSGPMDGRRPYKTSTFGLVELGGHGVEPSVKLQGK